MASPTNEDYSDRVPEIEVKFDASKYPREIANNLDDFQKSLDEVETVLMPLKQVDNYSTLSVVDRAKLELVTVYAINSMFWTYLCLHGINPREHPIKHELGRIQSYMSRIKEIMDKEKAAKLDMGAAKRFVKAALSEPKKGSSKSRKRSAPKDKQSAGPSKRR